MSCGKSLESDEKLESDLGRMVQSLITQAGNSAQVLECYYWTREPGLPELIRAFLTMPIEARTALRAFLAAAVVRSSITVCVDATGALTLRSPEAAEALATDFGHAHQGVQ